MINPAAVASAMTMYDAVSDFAKKHGIDTDEAIKSIVGSILKHPGQGIGTDDLSKAWDAARMEEVLKNTPYEDGDIDAEYEEDVNGDGDVDVSKVDINGDGESDAVVVTADTKKEEKDAEKLAQDLTGDEVTSTGKTDNELDDNAGEAAFGIISSKPKSNIMGWSEIIKDLLPGLNGYTGNIQ